MNMHKLLKHQLSDFFTTQHEPSAELMDVFNMISQTYEFYEDKLKRLERERSLPEMVPVILKEAQA